MENIKAMDDLEALTEQVKQLSLDPEVQAKARDNKDLRLLLKIAASMHLTAKGAAVDVSNRLLDNVRENTTKEVKAQYEQELQDKDKKMEAMEARIQYLEHSRAIAVAREQHHEKLAIEAIYDNNMLGRDLAYAHQIIRSTYENLDTTIKLYNDEMDKNVNLQRFNDYAMGLLSQANSTPAADGQSNQAEYDSMSDSHHNIPVDSDNSSADETELTFGTTVDTEYDADSEGHASDTAPLLDHDDESTTDSSNLSERDFDNDDRFF